MPSKKQGEVSGSRLLDQVERMQAEVSALEDDVQRTERLVALGMMAGLIAHEFNNILTPISAYVQVALNHPGQSELSRRALVKTLEGTSRAAQVAQVILDITRTPQDRRGTAPDEAAEHCSVADAVGAALRAIERSNAPFGVELHIEPETTARISPVALQTIVLNLLLNAQAAMSSSGGVLRVSARGAGQTEIEQLLRHKVGCSTWNFPTSEQLVRIDVEDGGRGISQTQLREIRSKVPALQATPVSSSGLGLAVCRSLIEASGGFLAIDSTPGEGTVCSVILPAARNQDC